MSPSHSSDRNRRLLEEYTPDGTPGRLGLSAVAGSIGLYSIALSIGFLFNPVFGSPLLVPLAMGLGIGLVALTLLTLWPVYLSAIGRLDSPAGYGRERRTLDSSSSSPDPTERLRREYERGAISEAELEAELEALFERSERGESAQARSQSSQDDQRIPEPDRSR